ncbi:Immunity protein Imm1 [Streptomyces sp. TLI_105]|nr:Immunity protein Imm1 [Streptomyces sp. TLI_105]
MGIKAEAYYESEHSSDPAKIEAPEDVDRVIDKLLTGEKFHTLAKLFSTERPMLPSGFPDHEFMVGVDSSLQVGALTFGDENGSFTTVGGPGSREEPAYHFMGHRHEFPENCEVSLDLIRKAVKEFVLSGGKRPECVDWKKILW